MNIIKKRCTFRRTIFYFFVLLNMLLLKYLITSLDPSFNHQRYFIDYCYGLNIQGVLPELDHYHLYKTERKRIFFIETSCKDDIDQKQACSVEAALRTHPTWAIYLIFVGPVLFLKNSSLLVPMMETFDNLHLASINIETFLKRTPLEYVWSEGLFQQSEDLPSHASVFLRYLLLWKFGGIYMDLDSIVLRSLEDLSSDFIGKEDDDNFGTGVIGLSNTNIGRAISNFALMALKDFEPKSWAGIGPRLMKRVLTVLCGQNITKPESMSKCPDFKVYNWNKFYPIAKNNWRLLYQKYKNFMDVLLESHAVHIWSRKSYFIRLPQDSLYASIAEKHCPGVHLQYFGE